MRGAIFPRPTLPSPIHEAFNHARAWSHLRRASQSQFKVQSLTQWHNHMYSVDRLREGKKSWLWPSIVGPWLGSASPLAYHSTSPSQLRDLMSIRTIPFECGGLWNESFPELLVQSCTVDPATHRLGPTRRWAVIVCNLYSRMELSFSETDCCSIHFIFKTVHCASSSTFLPFFHFSFSFFHFSLYGSGMGWGQG